MKCYIHKNTFLSIAFDFIVIVIDIWNDCRKVYTILKNISLILTGIQLPWQLHGSEASSVRDLICEKVYLNLFEL